MVTRDLLADGANSTRSGEQVAARYRSVGALAKSALLASSAGFAALLLGGFPVWAARRILYPVSAEPVHAALELPEGVSLPAEPVRFLSAKNHELSGWFVPGPENAAQPWPTILLVHGYAGYKEQMATYASALRRGGFASLMFDMQGSGLRRGQPVTLGFQERHDVAGACGYLQSRPDVDPERIGILGVSMGAATSLLAAAELPEIKAVVSDSSYADLDSMVQPGLQAFIGPLARAFAPLILWHAERMAGTTTRAVVPEKAAAQLGGRPLFIVHGETDDLIPVESAHRILKAASGPAHVWTVPDCTHAQAPAVAAEEYTRRVNEFFQGALGVPKPD